MPLVKLGMGQQTTVNDNLVVSKHVAEVPQWNSHVAESATQVDDLLCSSPCSIRLRSKCCCLNCTLFLGIPINGTLVDEVENPGNRTSRKHVMTQICVDIMRKCNMLSKRLRTVLWDDFFDVAVD